MDNENVKNEEKFDEENGEAAQEKKSYDVTGLLIGALFGILIAAVGVTNVLMGVTVGMFLGLLIGSSIKKKS